MSALGLTAALTGGLLLTALVLWRHKGLIAVYPAAVALALFAVYSFSPSQTASNAFLFSGITYLNIGLYGIAKRLGSFQQVSGVFRQWFSIEGRKGSDIVPRKSPAPAPVPERVPRPLLAGLLLLLLSALFTLL